MNSTETGPLSSEDLRVLDRVFARRKSIARAVSLARGNGAFSLASGILCLPFAIFDGQVLIAAAVLALAGAIELRGARMLRELDLRAPRWLSRNQLGLLLAIALYCASGIVSGLRAAPSPTAALDAAPDLGNQIGDISEMLGSDSGAFFDHAYRGAVIGLYVAILFASALYQGGCAYYYAKRAPLLREHREQSPRWALELERRLLGW